jgi:ketosteroid isomerase-like protein
MYIRILLAIIVSAVSCSSNDNDSGNTLKIQLQQLGNQRMDAEKRGDLEAYLAFYDPEVIVMPEYQPTINGIKTARRYYGEIFNRILVRDSKHTTTEVLDFDSTVVEFGTFIKRCSLGDSLITLQGKYCNVWLHLPNGDLRIKGECFGYFHPVKDPAPFVVESKERLMPRQPPFELLAYNALMEKGVRTRDGSLRADFFTEDGIFYPFADSAVVGMKSIKPYLVSYSTGNVRIDSISCSTRHYEKLKEHVLEYDEFKVTWEVDGFKGKTQGKGIRLWKRMPDMSLRLFREIGTHNYQ